MGKIPNIGIYLRTIRYLKLRQILGRIWFYIGRYARVSEQPLQRRDVSYAEWSEPVRREVSMTAATRFRFLNQEFDISDLGWDHPSLQRLWRYNLHYFDDLNAWDSDTRAEWHRDLLIKWVRQNPPFYGTGWEPYPTSVRIVNWVKWVMAGNELPHECLHSLAIQARWLRRRLETHLLGNHLFVNAKALVFAGFFFDGEEAMEWLEKGVSIVDQQMKEQILRDGGHFERSTMYHALVLEDVLDLRNIFQAFRGSVPPKHYKISESWWVYIEDMFKWMSAMCHPDGEISFFNDAAMGIAPTLQQLQRYAVSLGIYVKGIQSNELTVLADSGYIRASRDRAVVLIDVANVGPEYLPGHAHADTLSFEMSLGEQRVFVNSGTSCYEAGNERQKQRSTRSHNTVEVDGQDSTEVWSSFRVGRRAYPKGLRIQRAEDVEIICSHDGYQRAFGGVLHERAWKLGRGRLVVEDRIKGSFNGAVARLHLHPEIRFKIVDSDEEQIGTAILTLPNGEEMTLKVIGGGVTQEPSNWYPRFGTCIPNTCIVIHFKGSVMKVECYW